jgi:hypothetical protein
MTVYDLEENQPPVVKKTLPVRSGMSVSGLKMLLGPIARIETMGFERTVEVRGGERGGLYPFGIA